MNSTTMRPIAILGAGAWGTALALYLARRGQEVHLWSIEQPQVKAMIAEGTNQQYLPGYPFPPTIHPQEQLEAALRSVQDVVVVVPSAGFRSTLLMAKPFLASQRILCATKGMDMEKKQLLHSTAADIMGPDFPYAVLSGPSFAKEVAAGLPTAVVIASQHPSFAKELQARFHSSLFQVEVSTDIIGVEIGGIVKNVIAIAAGIADGMQLGANARSSLITRGFNEMLTLGIAVGGRNETFAGLAGIGDLILTCTDDLSRNRRFGLAVGKGLPKEQVEQEIGHVVEGKRNAELIIQLAKQQGIHLPLCELVLSILEGKAVPQEGLRQLFN